MIVTDIVQIIDKGNLTISCEVFFEKENFSSTYFISYPSTEYHQRPADGFFVLLILISMVLGEQLQFDTPVSNDIVKSAEQNTIPIMQEWFPQLSPPSLHFDQVTDLPARGNKQKGALFSGGLDSWHTLINHKNEINYLIHIRGFEIPISNTILWNKAHDRVKKIANTFDKKLFSVSTNFADITRERTKKIRKTTWPNVLSDAWFGHLLCSIGILLQPKINHLFIPSSYTENRIKIASSPLIEPKLSTNNSIFSIKGIEKNRIEKLQEVSAAYPDFIDNFRICVDKKIQPSDDILNCGKCLKCERSQVEFKVCNLEVPEHLFYKRLDLGKLSIKKPRGDTQTWLYIADEAGKKELKRIQKDIHIMLFQSHLMRKVRRLCYKIKVKTRRYISQS